jgi:PIN domain nuclease of toxin-antitoxin system
MNYLLDTHTFLWFISGDPALPPAVRAHIEAPDSLRYLSVGSLWEMAITVNAGKLHVGMPFPTLIDLHVLGNGLRILGIGADHLERFSQLPLYHKDPFDRLIIAQSLSEEMPILGRDAMFDAYGVQRSWDTAAPGDQQV